MEQKAEANCIGSEKAEANSSSFVGCEEQESKRPKLQDENISSLLSACVSWLRR